MLKTFYTKATFLLGESEKSVQVLTQMDETDKLKGNNGACVCMRRSKKGVTNVWILQCNGKKRACCVPIS